MTIRKDILLDADMNFMTDGGDFVTGESDAQNVELLLVSTKGTFRQFPTIGAGIGKYLKKQNTDLNAMEREIVINLQADGYKSQLVFDESGAFNLDYTPNYN